MGEREHCYSHCSDAGNNMRHPGHAVDNGTILAIDTSTERLGVALLHGTRCIERQLQLGTGHANQVLALVAEVLAEADIPLSAMDAIAFSRGPGAFTGLRIAIGVAQGLALALECPVVPVSGLRVLAAGVTLPGPVLAVIDARMGEFYAASWLSGAAAFAGAAAALPESLLPPGALQTPCASLEVWHAVGPGWPALGATGQAPGGSGPWVATWPEVSVLARLGRAGLARGEGCDPADALPVYLRDQVARPSINQNVTQLS